MPQVAEALDYTTTRENWELRQKRITQSYRDDYTTTRENWELRPRSVNSFRPAYYTTTRENWELRLFALACFGGRDYTTTRENWELRRWAMGIKFWEYYTTAKENWKLWHEQQRFPLFHEYMLDKDKCILMPAWHKPCNLVPRRPSLSDFKGKQLCVCRRRSVR